MLYEVAWGSRFMTRLPLLRFTHTLGRQYLALINGSDLNLK